MSNPTVTTAAAAIAAHTEREKMLCGELYYASDPELCAARARCAAAVAEFNSAPGDLARRDRVALQNKILNLPPPPENPTDPGLAEYPYLLPPVFVDYGVNLTISQGSFVNFNCCFLDTCQITIGPRVLVAPGVSFYAATHPLDPRARNGMDGPEMGKPIMVEEDVWIGGSAIICPGVTLGKGCVVGAGSVVTKSVEPYTVVAGNPAKVIRKIDMSQPPAEVPPPPASTSQPPITNQTTA